MPLEFIPHTKRRGMTKAELSADFARSLLDYDPDTGILLWKVARHGTARKGTRAGSAAHWNGYRVISIGGSQYQEHTLAWFIHHGSWPAGHLDHANGDRADNRISNLRECSASENAQNRRPDIDNKSGFLGVYRPKRKNKWRAQIKKDGVRYFLGDFDTPEQAHAAYCEAKKVLHPFQPIPRKAGRA